MNYEADKQQMWKKIEAAQSRNARRLADHAANARDGAMRIAKEHPVRVIAGALALGALVAVFVPKGNRRRVGSKASALVSMATKLGMDYAVNTQKAAKDVSRASQERLAEVSETFMDSGESFRQEVERIATEASDTARGFGGQLAKQGAQVAKKVKTHIGR